MEFDRHTTFFPPSVWGYKPKNNKYKDYICIQFEIKKIVQRILQIFRNIGIQIEINILD